MNERMRITIAGAVQGVGFRPFVYRLAADLGIAGWVNNSSQGVLIEAEAAPGRLQAFLARLESEKPPHALIQHLSVESLAPVGYAGFEIHHSDNGGGKTALILPDLAICPECLREILDPNNRRYRYPFTNCTHCGPRFSIIEALPYDRPNTTMKHFPMCDECREEYENPLDRRFHAQPNACPHCGPHLEWWDGAGNVLADHHPALLEAAEALRRGEIVAVKGLGGFHLMVDARDAEAIARLRQRKQREDKPLAVMYPTLEQIQAECEVSDLEEQLLCSTEAPIVLLNHTDHEIAPNAAPGNPTLGVMLPYTPLHHLLMGELGFPVIATSGNLSGEPICIDELEALERLGGIADVFLVHNRPIARHVDDSVVRVMAGKEQMMRRARGYAPLPVSLDQPLPPVIAVGAHLKNTAAVAVGKDVFISQHIGDLDTPEAFAAFQRVLADFQRLYELRPETVVCDLHPDYLSTQYAESLGLPIVRVQHHYAHVLACMAEHHLHPPVLGISWDGTGYGTDGTIWGGEFLRVTPDGFERAAHLRTFRLPGGDQAVKEPRRSALGLLYEIYSDEAFEMTYLAPVASFSAQERKLLRTMLMRGTNAPVTSSAGRLFDGVAALLGVRQRVSFEGQAAMELEFAINRASADECYPYDMTDIRGGEDASGATMDWRLMIRGILHDLGRGVTKGQIAVRFHNTLVTMMVHVAQQVAVERVVLSGGCFQNRYLTERAITALRSAGFQPYWSCAVPANDGGIALGQIAALRKD